MRIDKHVVLYTLVLGSLRMMDRKFSQHGKSVFKIVTGTAAGKIPLGRPRRRCEDNIRMYIKEIGIRGIGLSRLRLVIIGEPLEMRH